MVSLPNSQKGLRGTGVAAGSDMAGAMSTGSFCARAMSTFQQSPSRRKAAIVGSDNILLFMENGSMSRFGVTSWDIP
jgi:hypothetical protein